MRQGERAELRRVAVDADVARISNWITEAEQGIVFGCGSAGCPPDAIAPNHRDHQADQQQRKGWAPHGSRTAATATSTCSQWVRESGACVFTSDRRLWIGDYISISPGAATLTTDNDELMSMRLGLPRVVGLHKLSLLNYQVKFLASTMH